MNYAGGGNYQSVGSTYGVSGGGGGYMNTMGGGGGYGGSSSMTQSPSGMDKKRSAPKNQSIRAVTSIQIKHAIPPDGDEPFKIDGKDVGQVVLVGEIIEVNEMATNIMYKVDDRMGPPVEVRRWVDNEESPLENQRRAACREGIYIKVVGHLRLFNKQHNLVGFFIKPIEDFNEVTHHLTEAIYNHLAVTKGLSLPAGFTEATAQTDGGNASFSSWNPQATSTQVAAGSSYSGGMNSGLDGVQKQVLSIITNSGTEQGMHVREISLQAKNHGYSDISIKKAIDFLSNEGHIYSTIDDDHFKSTEDY